mgnify:CR=1 FL=1
MLLRTSAATGAASGLASTGAVAEARATSPADGSRLVYGPVPVRTGRNGYETRTGLKKIYWRHKNHVSSIYHVAMPYSQFFDGGQAFHSVGLSMWNPPGSHGCVNMTTTDAKKYWSLLKTGDDVYVYGRKPGT